MIFRILLRYFFCLCIFILPKATASTEDLPLWEVGGGFAALRFEHYPASDEYTDFILAYPTFDYRGEILRADDRRGVRAFILRTEVWSLDLGAAFLPATISENEARQGMDDLPWGLQTGPQLVGRFGSGIGLEFHAYQAFVSDLNVTKTNGGLFRARLSWQPKKAFMRFFDQSAWSLTLSSGTKDFLATYYDVGAKDANSQRPSYEARSGLLGLKLGFLQNWRIIGNWVAYASLEHSIYSMSANRQSPLHRSDQNFTFNIGVTYKLFESERRAVPEDQSQGLIRTLRGPL